MASHSMRDRLIDNLADDDNVSSSGGQSDSQSAISTGTTRSDDLHAQHRRRRHEERRARTSSRPLSPSRLAHAESDVALSRTQSRSRLPYHHEGDDESMAGRDRNMAFRYRYYGRLEPGPNSRLRIPDHVVPDNFFNVLPFADLLKEGKQGSVITVFSIWNTMMGTSLLSMPWALHQAGLVWGIFLMCLMGAIACYTAYIVVKSPKALGVESPEFSHVCGYFWGRPGELVATVFSVVTMVGGAVAYWVLMTNFLYYTGVVIHDAVETNSTSLIILANRSLTCDVTCVKSGHTEPGQFSSFSSANSSSSDDAFHSWWGLQSTVPIYLALLAFPLLNFKSPTFFTKFNVFGTVSVVYLIIFVIIKSSECGFHLDLVDERPSIPYYSAPFNWHFPALTGTLSLSYFIHNAILSILRNQRHPENNERDLITGYLLCIVTYVFIAFMFYASFPLAKDCIADNLLNNFGTGDALSAVARVFLLFQMLCVLPLILYIVRAQISFSVFGKPYPGLKWVVSLNVAILTVCICFAIFMPTVGTIIRFTGSISGLMYIFTLPVAVQLKLLQRENKLTYGQIAFHGCITALGVANLVAQFMV